MLTNNSYVMGQIFKCFYKAPLNLECVKYCDSCSLKKVVFIKKVLLIEVELIFIYVWLKLWLKSRLNKKVV